MSALPMEERWLAVFRLQRLQLQSRKITISTDDAERATTLVLSPNRTARNFKFLTFDAIRDARRRRPRLPVPLTNLHALRDVAGFRELSPQCRQTDEPAAEAIAADLEQTIRIAIREIAGAEVCFDGMLAGETEKETAATPRYARRREQLQAHSKSE